MRVLVTGNRGYLGSVVSEVLRHARFDVVGLDSGLFRGTEFGRVHDPTPTFDMDLRDVDFTDLLSLDAVVHLAALSDDPSGRLNEPCTDSLNRWATIRLAESCIQAGVSRFLFASTCAVYGASGTRWVDEESMVRPLTAYARSKLAAEESLRGLTDRTFCPVILRLGTNYGPSASLRLDTVVNELVAAARTTGSVPVGTSSDCSSGTYRPLVHVEDTARCIAALLLTPDDDVRGRVFNVVQTDENYRIQDIVDLISELIPSTRVTTPSTPGAGAGYRVDGRRLASTLPGFRFRWTLKEGIKQLARSYAGAGLTAGDWRSARFRRAPWLQRLLDEGTIDQEFRVPAVTTA